MNKQHQTIKNHSQSLFKEKGSKHFGYSFNVSSKEQVKKILVKLNNENKKANHICYAYRILDNDAIIEYANDDGEPNNSAGAPILGQIKSLMLINTLVCVIRYFGGTKLGVPGLINAYKTTAKQVLDESGTIIFEQYFMIRIDLKNEQLGPVLAYLGKERIEITKQDYIDNMHIVTVKTNKSSLLKIKTKFEDTVKITWQSI